MKDFLQTYGPVQDKIREEAVKAFCERLLVNAELVDVSGIDPDHAPLSGAISALDQIIQDCLVNDLGIMAPSGFVIIYTGERWIQLTSEEAHGFLSQYCERCDVPNVDRALINRLVDYLFKITEGMTRSLERFQRKVAAPSMRTDSNYLKIIR